MPTYKEVLKEIAKQHASSGAPDESSSLQRKSEINKLDHLMEMNKMEESKERLANMVSNSVNYQSELKCIKKDLGLEKALTTFIVNPKSKVDHGWSLE